MRIAVLGFGLIGGSLARALHAREPGEWEVAAWSPSGSGAREASRDGVVDRAAAQPSEAIAGAELVVLAAPPLACLDLIDALAGELAPALDPGALVTDVASTKRRIIERAADRGVPFVGGHPMAGRETTGYGAADADLFLGRPWIVCPGADAAATDRIERLARAAGADPVRMDAATHDKAVAAVSHLPLLVAAALVEAATRDGWDEARRVASSGWRDTTRLARGDIEMGTGIASTNADVLTERLRILRAVINGWIDDLEAGDETPDRVRRRLAAARRVLEPDDR